MKKSAAFYYSSVKCVAVFVTTTQLAFNCSKSTIETPEQRVTYAQAKY